MSWNYRAVRTTNHLPVDGEQYWFAIHEAYYDAEGNIKAITEKPATIESESMEGLRGVRLMMLDALKRPPLIYEELPWVASHNAEGGK